jgi:multidrug resistance efflux pump
MADEQPAAKASWIPTVTGRIFGLAIVIGAIVLGLYVLRLYYIYPRTDDAYVRANVVGIAPHVSGPIVDLPIHDNQHIARGGLLFVVDPRPYQATLDRAEASLALTNLQIDALQNAIHSAQARQQQLEATSNISIASCRCSLAISSPPTTSSTRAAVLPPRRPRSIARAVK